MDDVYKALPVSFTLNERCVILRKCCKMCDECIPQFLYIRLDAEHNRRVKESLFSQFQQAQHSYDEKLVQSERVFILTSFILFFTESMH